MSLIVPIVNSFLLLNSIPLYGYATICLPVSLLIDTCFQSGDITNKGAMNICVQICIWTYALFSLGGKHGGVGWLGHVADVGLTSEETAKLFQRSCTIFRSCLQRLRVSVVPHPRQHFVVSLFNFRCFDRCWAAPNHFNLHAPDL